MGVTGTLAPTMNDDVRGGWQLHVLCVVCKAEDMFTGVVMALAADAAERAGWTVDRDALYTSATDRYATCPNHSKPGKS